MMALYGFVETTIVLLTLSFPVITCADHYYRATTKMQTRQHLGDTTYRNGYPVYRNYTNSHSNIESRSGTETYEQQAEQSYDGPIIYPDVGLNTTCTHGLCENVIGYPKERIKQLLSRSQYAGVYLVDEGETVNIFNRIKPDEEDLCETRLHTIYPEKAKNVDKVEKVIVNVEGHKQGIAVETCITTGECKYSKGFPAEYTSFCKQKFIHKKLMVLGDDDNFVFDSFEIPSCCVCTLKKK